jgi:hypothetical protein
MNDMTPIPRHRQRPISFRSDLAAQLLAQLTRGGRSQAEVIEDALAKAANEQTPLTLEEKIARIDAIVRPAHGISGKTYHEIREDMYDENGLPR